MVLELLHLMKRSKKWGVSNDVNFVSVFDCLMLVQYKFLLLQLLYVIVRNVHIARMLVISL